jgi:transposase-like protein
MGKTRRRFSKEFKAQVAIEALKEQKVLTQISIDYGVHPNQITL